MERQFLTIFEQFAHTRFIFLLGETLLLKLAAQDLVQNFAFEVSLLQYKHLFILNMEHRGGIEPLSSIQLLYY